MLDHVGMITTETFSVRAAARNLLDNADSLQRAAWQVSVLVGICGWCQGCAAKPKPRCEALVRHCSQLLKSMQVLQQALECHSVPLST